MERRVQEPLYLLSTKEKIQQEFDVFFAEDNDTPLRFKALHDFITLNRAIVASHTEVENSVQNRGKVAFQLNTIAIRKTKVPRYAEKYNAVYNLKNKLVAHLEKDETLKQSRDMSKIAQQIQERAQEYDSTYGVENSDTSHHEDDLFGVREDINMSLIAINFMESMRDQKIDHMNHNTTNSLKRTA